VLAQDAGQVGSADAVLQQGVLVLVDGLDCIN
jgi:hypothetical protein